MTRIRFIKESADWATLKTLTTQFYRLVEFPDKDKEFTFLNILNEVEPQKLKKIYDQIYKKSFEDKFKDEITRPTYKVFMASGDLNKYDDEGRKNLFVDFENILRNMEFYIIELYDSIHDPFYSSSIKNDDKELKYSSDRNKITYTNFQNSYNYFLKDYKTFLIENELSRSFIPKLLRNYDDVKRNPE